MTVTSGGSTTEASPGVDLGELAEIGRHRSRSGPGGSLGPGVDELEAELADHSGQEGSYVRVPRGRHRHRHAVDPTAEVIGSCARR